jgi:hypothetical protein
MATTSTTRRSTSPVALALLATGGFTMLSAAILLSSFALSPYAIQNDVYLGNLFIGPPLLVIGSLLFVASLLIARIHGRSMAWGQGLLLALAGSSLEGLLYMLVGGHYYSVGPPSNWPPYLNESMMGITLGLGLAVFLIGWVWGALMARQRKSAATPAGA